MYGEGSGFGGDTMGVGMWVFWILLINAGGESLRSRHV
jgi:hypothetical protein